MYFVYIIKSLIVLRYYIGSTENVDRRLSDHNSGKVKSTKAYKPWEIVYLERFDIKSYALKREKQIKSYKSGNAFKKLLGL
jgi:putative endonuclease